MGGRDTSVLPCVVRHVAEHGIKALSIETHPQEARLARAPRGRQRAARTALHTHKETHTYTTTQHYVYTYIHIHVYTYIHTQ